MKSLRILAKTSNIYLSFYFIVTGKSPRESKRIGPKNNNQFPTMTFYW